MSDNGKVTPFPSNRIPILGQPFTMKTFFVTVQIVCNCEAKEPVLLVANGVGTCPGCRRQYQLQQVKGLQLGIALVGQAETEPPPPAV